ncbi:MAG: alpha/beta fold hydrolase [Janthinobacterium lividum]
MNHISSPAPTGADITFREPDRTGSIAGLSRRGFHRVAYVEWGDPAADRVAICVHGLSRQGRDFDVLAAAMADRGWRVICPDLVGRGRSGWLGNPDDYNLPQYAADMAALIARSGATTVDWVGTSLGGLIGMVLAGQPNSPIGRLVINDIGPFLPWQALSRLASTVRNAPKVFPTLSAMEQHLRTTLAPFGNLSDAEWHHLVEHGAVQEPGGAWRKRADPEITAAFRPGLFFNLSLWTYWDAITCPTLVLRGETSDLLLPSTAKDMQRRGPEAELVEIPGCGHAPALMEPSQVSLITDWLDSVPPDRH